MRWARRRVVPNHREMGVVPFMPRSFFVGEGDAFYGTGRALRSTTAAALSPSGPACLPRKREWISNAAGFAFCQPCRSPTLRNTSGEGSGNESSWVGNSRKGRTPLAVQSRSVPGRESSACPLVVLAEKQLPVQPGCCFGEWQVVPLLATFPAGAYPTAGGEFSCLSE